MHIGCVFEVPPSPKVFCFLVLLVICCQHVNSNSNMVDAPAALVKHYSTFFLRKQKRECDKLRREFFDTGCVVELNSPPPPFLCFTIWSEMKQLGEGICPFKPCQGYNQTSRCVIDQNACCHGQGQVVPFGLCNSHKVCCLFPGDSP